jgi:hypothetical protein
MCRKFPASDSIPFYGTHDPFWVKIGTTDLHIMLLSICKFRENRGRESRNFLTCEPCACRGDPRTFISNARLGKACVLNHGELFAILLCTLWLHFLITTSITTETTPFSARHCNVARCLTYLLRTTCWSGHLMKYHTVIAHIIYSKSHNHNMPLTQWERGSFPGGKAAVAWNWPLTSI